jgi:hypothetical protein
MVRISVLQNCWHSASIGSHFYQRLVETLGPIPLKPVLGAALSTGLPFLASVENA